MTENPYAPPKASVEPVSTSSASAGGLFWVRFYLSPFGRTGRLFYWLIGLLPLTLIGFAAGFFIARTPGGIPYLLAITLLLIWPQAVILARRLHDLDIAGWWVVLLWALPLALKHTPLPAGTGTVVSFLVVVVIGVVPGTRGRNRYGSDPRRKNTVA